MSVMEYQEEQEIIAAEQESPIQTFATIGGVFEDGVSLIFDGEETATEKHYKCNTFFKYQPGDRVYILKDSGTYVVICVIGAPAQSIAADTAGTATTAETAGTAENATNATNAANATNAENATNAQTASGITAGSNLGAPVAYPNGYLGKAYLSELFIGTNASHLNILDDIIRHPKATNSNYATSNQWKGQLGTSAKPWGNIYTNGSVRLGNAQYSLLGFFGATPIVLQTLSKTSQNMGYSEATASNYLTLLNNLIGILIKHGLIKKG